MKGLVASLWAEGLKVRNSKILIITLVFFAFIGLIMGLMMFVVHHPELAGRSAALSAKISILGNGDWPSLFNLLIQVILALGPIGFGMVTSWVFGREYADRVIKDLFALPVSRVTLVISKFVIILIWCILLTLTLFISGLLIGLAIKIPGWSAMNAQNSFIIFFTSSILTFMLCTPVAFLACVSRGYLLPIGFSVLTLILTNFIAIGLPNIIPYFPWAVPALYTGIAGRELPQAGALSYIILFLTCILGFIGTSAWWRFADQT
jgi:ABC-2 type transport system permease protein